MINLDNIRQHQRLFIFFSFAAILFFKNILFQIIPFNVISILELWRHPIDFILYWMPKLLPAFFLASFTFITRHYWWTWLTAIILDIWAIANLVYFESSGYFLTVNEILIADNLNGFWNSIIPFLHLNQLIFPLSTIIYILLLLIIKPKHTKSQYRSIIITLVVLWLLAPYRFFYDNRSSNPYWTDVKKNTFFSTLNPFFFISDYIDVRDNPPSFNSEIGSVIHHSLVAYLPMTACDYIVWKISTKDYSKELSATPKMNKLLIPTKETIHPKRNIIIILVESFESWTIGENRIENQTITPNICSFINKYHCKYFPNTVSQIKYGSSGDGQMTIISGLLPISRGIACMRLPNNVYPSIAKHYEQATIVNPCPKIWNQEKISVQYGLFRKREKIGYNDASVFKELCVQSDSCDFCLAITISSHLPFDVGKNGPLKFSNDMPSTLHDYINSIHYMDSCFGVFLNKFQSDSNLQNSIVVITGDHTIFNEQSNARFQSYARKYNQPVPKTKGFVPLIIYSPDFNSSITIPDTIYQMDIYPTLLQLTGQQNHTWRGFGVDVTNDSLRHNRPFSVEEAYRISDMIINSNYLKQYEKQL